MDEIVTKEIAAGEVGDSLSPSKEEQILSETENREEQPEIKESGPQKWGRGPLPLILAFFLPALIFSVCLIIGGVYPFGDEQILNYDGWHQYYPFLLKLWDHFHEGTGLLYDWSMGMGTNFLSMLSYYGTSPFNLLLFLVPEREFRSLFTLFVILRIGFSGLFTALFLKKTFKNTGWSIAFFSLGYALCGYLMGYYWNVMWLDAVALYPLLCLATVKLFREGKSALYVFCVGLSLFSGYYIGYMSLVFTILVFFSLCILDKVRLSDFFRKGFRLLFTTFLGVAMSAVILLPAYFGLLNTASIRDATGVYFSFYESVRDLVAALASFHEPAFIDGLPNLATCALLILFAFAFLLAKNIALREKFVAFFTLLFLLFSMNFSVFNYIWHGMHFTNQIPYRFAFLFAFVVVVIAYAYYKKAMVNFGWTDAVGMAVFAGVLGFCAFGVYPNGSIFATVAVMAVGIVLCALYSAKVLNRRVLSFFVCAILLFEMSTSAYLGTRAVGTSSYSDYYDGKTGEEILSLVEKTEELEKDSLDFYRLETTEWRSLNDSCFYGYNGISQFASSANRNVSYFLQQLGMPADPGSNRFVYVHGTPLSNTLLGVKYLITKTGHLSDTDLTCISPATGTVTSALYECRGFSGLAFMVEEEGGGFAFDESMRPYEKQNALFRALTGVEGDLFSPILATSGEHTNLEVTSLGDDNFEYKGILLGEDEDASRVIRLLYEMPKDGTVYIYADVPMANYVQVNHTWHCIEEYPNFFSAGYFSAGDTFHLRTFIAQESGEEITGNAGFDVVVMDRRLWEEGIALLQDEKMTVTAFEDAGVEGVVNARKDGYLYTSIPMELEGSWTVRVDGKEVPVTPFAGAFVGVYLEKGEHRVEFSYSPPGFEKGLIISFVALLLWGGLWFAERKGFVLFREKPLPPVPEEEEGEPCREEVPPSVETEGEEYDHSQTDVADSQGP